LRTRSPMLGEFTRVVIAVADAVGIPSLAPVVPSASTGTGCDASAVRVVSAGRGTARSPRAAASPSGVRVVVVVGWGSPRRDPPRFSCAAAAAAGAAGAGAAAVAAASAAPLRCTLLAVCCNRAEATPPSRSQATQSVSCFCAAVAIRRGPDRSSPLAGGTVPCPPHFSTRWGMESCPPRFFAGSPGRRSRLLAATCCVVASLLVDVRCVSSMTGGEQLACDKLLSPPCDSACCPSGSRAAASTPLSRFSAWRSAASPCCAPPPYASAAPAGSR
jgi:hypothetical protein